MVREPMERVPVFGSELGINSDLLLLQETLFLIQRVHGSLIAYTEETVRRMAVVGVGLARPSGCHITADLATGRLLKVLAKTVEGEDVNALYIGGRRLKHRVRVSLDFKVPTLQNFLSSDRSCCGL